MIHSQRCILVTGNAAAKANRDRVLQLGRENKRKQMPTRTNDPLNLLSIIPNKTGKGLFNGKKPYSAPSFTKSCIFLSSVPTLMKCILGIESFHLEKGVSMHILTVWRSMQVHYFTIYMVQTTFPLIFVTLILAPELH